MKHIKTIDKAVTLVTVPAVISLTMYPHIGAYKNPYILRTVPCEEKNGKFFDLRTGEQVQKTENTLVWSNLSGSFFRYPDGYELLLSRRYADNKLLVFEPEEKAFNPESMLFRPVIFREEKKSY